METGFLVAAGQLEEFHHAGVFENISGPGVMSPGG